MRLWRVDLQRFRVLVAVVVGLELLRAAIVEWVLHRDPLASGGPFGGDLGSFEFQTLDGALWLATAVTTAILVQADHPADDRAFWRTRPVSARQLAVAKLSLLAVLFVLVPLLVNTARLAAYGAPVGAIAASAVQFVVIGGSIGMPAWALALAARTLPRFLAMAAGIAIARYVALAAAVTFVPPYVLGPRFFGRFRAASNGFAPALADWQAVDRHGWVVALLVTAAAAALLIGYYRTRRAAVSIAAGLALIAVPIVVPQRDLSVAADPELAAIVDGGLRLVGSLGLPSKPRVESEVPRPDVLPLRGSLVLSSALPLNVSAGPEFGHARLSMRDAELIVEGSPYCCDNTTDTMAAMAAASGTAPEGTVTGPFGLMPSGNPGGMPWNRFILFTVPTRDADRLRGRAVGVEAAVRLQFARHRLIAALPLRAGSAFRTDAYLIEILAIEKRARVAICRFARFPAVAALPGPPLRFFVGNPREYVLPAMSHWRQETELPGGGIGWVQGRTWVARMTLPLDLLGMGDRDRPPPLPTRLYIVVSRPAGELRTTITARDVPVIDTSDLPGADRRY
ncbi:MAG: hypothetical protein ACHQRO_00500 [Vicinamibacteria bacterium]